MPTDAAQRALAILRDGSLFQWYVIPLFALVVLYVYSVEIERRNWNLVFAGLAFWGMDWFNEIWNALVFHVTDHAPVWGAPGKTAYLILIGLNIEICSCSPSPGIVVGKMLPPDKGAADPRGPEPPVPGRGERGVLRGRRDLAELGRRPHLGLLVVECALADG